MSFIYFVEMSQIPFMYLLKSYETLYVVQLFLLTYVLRSIC